VSVVVRKPQGSVPQESLHRQRPRSGPGTSATKPSPSALAPRSAAAAGWPSSAGTRRRSGGQALFRRACGLNSDTSAETRESATTEKPHNDREHNSTGSGAPKAPATAARTPRWCHRDPATRAFPHSSAHRPATRSDGRSRSPRTDERAEPRRRIAAREERGRGKRRHPPTSRTAPTCGPGNRAWESHAAVAQHGTCSVRIEGRRSDTKGPS